MSNTKKQHSYDKGSIFPQTLSPPGFGLSANLICISNSLRRKAKIAFYYVISNKMRETDRVQEIFAVAPRATGLNC